MPPAVDLLRALAPVLARFGDRWYVFGAQAVVAYGAPRLTADVDVTASLIPDDPEAFALAMNEAGFELRVTDLAAFVSETHVVPFTHSSSGIPLDVVLAGAGLEEEFLDRAARIDLGGIEVPVITAEDLIVTKVLAGRAKDLDDVRGIVRERRDRLDLSRVRRLLGDLDTLLSRDDLLASFERLI